jgi:hypothetical protein
MDVLAPLLPSKYAPLRSGGEGLQSVYLTRLPEALAGALIDLIGVEARDIIRGHVLLEGVTSPAVGLLEWEEHEMQEVRSDSQIPETEREAIVLARRGQGRFKANVMRIERACRITGVTREEHLRASHCKPWRDSSNEERLDGENGLLLTPNADHLFDRGFIGFEDNGELLVSPVAHTASLTKMGIQLTQTLNVGRFSEGQRRYLRFHRESVLLKSKYLDDAS